MLAFCAIMIFLRFYAPRFSQLRFESETSTAGCQTK